MNFPEKLALLMERRKVTQKELGDAIGVSRQTVSLYVKGTVSPDLNKLKRIANFFDVDICSFVTDDVLPKKALEIIAIEQWCLKRGGEKLWRAVYGLLGLNDAGLDKANERIEELNELNRYSARYEDYLSNFWKDRLYDELQKNQDKE